MLANAATSSSPAVREMAASIQELRTELEVRLAALVNMFELEQRRDKAREQRRTEIQQKLAETRALADDLAAQLAELDEEEPSANAAAVEVGEQDAAADNGEAATPEAPHFDPKVAQHFAYDNRVRGWARQNGCEVAERGRINTTVVCKWLAANPQVLSEIKVG
jgi:cell division protein ZapA (FtsZ GTPase activity inhibitor)